MRKDISEKLFSVCKWLAIICFFPAIILTSLNLVNEIWLHNDWGENIGIWGDYFVKILGSSFCLALLIAMSEKEENAEEETD